MSAPLVRRAKGRQRSGPSRGVPPRRGWRAALPWGLLAVALLMLLPGSLLARSTTPPGADRAAVSSYSLVQRAPFNRPDFFPLDRRPDPAFYRPHADWIGRLILPEPAEAAASAEDWVWLEVEQAPAAAAHLVGRRLPLAWADQPRLRALVGLLTTDIHLGAEARSLAAQGNVVPWRLDGRSRVGPLQSLAGARPEDDLSVRLEGVELAAAAGLRAPQPALGEGPVLRIPTPPVQITGRWMARVRLLKVLPGREGAGGDLFVVRHYDPRSHSYGGPQETVRIPSQPPNRDGRRFFETTGLLDHPIGAEGWTVYGAPAADGLFTVQALLPQALVQLSPDGQLRGTAAGLGQIARGNWNAAANRRGSFRRTALEPDRMARPWAIGDHALLIHAFGGIGGPGGEPTPGFTVTGHFAFGEAEVIADPFGGEPRFDLRYHQIYANNPDGIVAGSQEWSAWSGDLQRGWLGLRPISDVLVRQDPELLAALRLQAEVLMARYRSGDGRGVAAVTATTSCVQDSAQALWTTVELLRQGLLSGPSPSAGQVGGESLGRAIEAVLVPFGIVRPDWHGNAELIATALRAADRAGPGSGVGPHVGPLVGPFQRGQSPLDALLSLHSILPRRGHDAFAALFLRRGAPLWILRTNQIPGASPRYEPLAPTLLLGRLPLVGELQRRLADGLLAPLDARQVGLCLLGFALYAAVALAQGLGSGFLEPHHPWPRPRRLVSAAAALLPMPALGEELLFRGALLPHPGEDTPWPQLLAWSALGIGLFVLYHPLAGRLWYRRAERVFHDPRFLLQTALLGVATTALYLASGSLWPAVLLHALAVLVWLERLGGRQHLAVGPAG
ncbi:MAG: CPBP family glutamic-type intramembrane protease [Cyanobacteria bacterium]|nr:CPBP family glutamic-type intramembrane protease [Cyanobacteriota bacterium]